MKPVGERMRLQVTRAGPVRVVRSGLKQMRGGLLKK